LTIRDNGVGMPKDFSAGKTNSLGLRLVRILTKQIHGELEFANREGTEFRILFPATNRRASET